ncbi:hypothetical protein [Macrococcus armenti]|uniref:hypothetical protein n=1 Tax=Macrococcus armenti TaxID=2875764 RepID=UPI001CCD037E|nr:hypothetical protein [Macrococcus armenti]UBH13549.1 hypothetical protein LAU43_02335 [Macrococcus armenti]
MYEKKIGAWEAYKLYWKNTFKWGPNPKALPDYLKIVDIRECIFNACITKQ